MRARIRILAVWTEREGHLLGRRKSGVVAGFGHSLGVSVEGDGRVKGGSQVTGLSE